MMMMMVNADQPLFSIRSEFDQEGKAGSFKEWKWKLYEKNNSKQKEQYLNLAHFLKY